MLLSILMSEILLCNLKKNVLYTLGIFGEIVYSLVGEQSKNFNIEPDSGIITVLNSLFLDRERQEDVSLSGVASDKAPMTTRKSTTVPVSKKNYLFHLITKKLIILF